MSQYGIPVYLFTGFLESGKTSVIKETLADPEFNDGEKTLLILCEEGLEELDEGFLRQTNTIQVLVEKEEELTADFLSKLDLQCAPDRVFVEFNGTWNPNTFLDLDFPLDWLLVQIIATVDASTFNLYINNMKSMIFQQLQHAEVIIFNRCDATTRKTYLRSNVKAINRKAQLVYESVDGSVDDLKEDELPFDIHADKIVIEDDDYGLWYMDGLDHPEKYDHKKIRIKGQVAQLIPGKPHSFVLGRKAMVCCAEDIQTIGFICTGVKAEQLSVDMWVTLEGELALTRDEDNQKVLYLKASRIEHARPAEEEFVNFS